MTIIHGMQAPASAISSDNSSGSGKKRLAMNAANPSARLKPRNTPTFSFNPDCTRMRSSLCTRGNASRTRCIILESLSSRSFISCIASP
ncbi:hypothetical protein D3C72_2022510 [compost metagenome]